MAKRRKGKVAETEARIKARDELLKEETPLCCLVNPYGSQHNRRKCEQCNHYICEDHISFVHGKFICKRCLSIELLFEDLGARDVDRKRQETPSQTKEENN